MRIVASKCNFYREPLSAPFGFKGGYLSELWQSVVLLEDEAGNSGLGLGVQSTLWSDSSVFVNNSESAGNSIMFLMTSFASRQALNLTWQSPIELLEYLLPITYEYGKKITGNPDLRLTFALNSLVAVDNAAWLLYSKANGISDFDTMLPGDLRKPLERRHKKLAAVPLISYGVLNEAIKQMLDDGYFFLKIKIGRDPDKNGSLKAMFDWDTNRLKDIHNLCARYSTPYTHNGRIAYYIDANGRYNKEYLQRFIDYAQRIGALEQIILFEEPFAEDCKEDVSGLPICAAADESAHSVKESLERIELGYKAVALKPIAKTLSMSLKIAAAARVKNISCFCADLTVNPVLVDWNKNVAARLEPLLGMNIGVLESNGQQNYRNWNKMTAMHPCCNAKWTKVAAGVYNLDNSFYAKSGAIFEPLEHYRAIL